MQGQNIVAIIPARGGSKSIPKKNIKMLGRHPLIAYSIAAGLRSKHIDRVIVSTDDKEIAAVSRKYGAEVPFKRPPKLAADATPDLPVFQHTIRWLASREQYHADIIVQLRPTSPLRPKFCVDDAIKTLVKSRADSVRCVTPAGENPFKMWRIANNQLIPLLQSSLHEPYNMPRQKLPVTYWQTGHVEVIRRDTIMRKHSMTGNKILPKIIDGKYAIDLDTLEQWQFAEYVLANWNLNMVHPKNLVAHNFA